MTVRRLGTTDLHITPIGLGTWALGGGDWEFGWGDQDDGNSIAAIHRAVELGVNWIDTAASYGLGHAEEVVARALEGLPSSERPQVFTKCGLVWTPRGHIKHRLKAESIRTEAEASLRRLHVEAIDLYQIHWPARPPEGPAPDIEEAWTTLIELQRKGKVRYIGVSNFNVRHLERIRSLARPVSLQPPYSILSREIEEDLLPYCTAHDIGVIIYSPLQSGLLTGKMNRDRIAALPANDWRRTKNLDFQEPRLSRNLEIVDLLKEVGRRYGRSPAEVAIAWTLRSPRVTGAIVGARRPEQIEQNLGAADLELDEGDLVAIDRVTLKPE